MSIRYALVGYDKTTERQVFREYVAKEAVPLAKKIAHIIPEDDDMGDWPLDPTQAQDIAGLLHREISPATEDYFLEPYIEG